MRSERSGLVLECVGAQATVDQAVENAREGSTIVIDCAFEQKPKVDVGLVQAGSQTWLVF